MGISTSRLCDRRAYRGRIDGEYRMRAPPAASRSRTRGWRTATGPMPVMISRSGRWPWRTTRCWPVSVLRSVCFARNSATSASTAWISSARAPLRRISVRESVNAPGWANLITLLSDTAYHSLIRRSGGVEHHHDTPPYPVTPSPTSGHSSPVGLAWVNTNYGTWPVSQHQWRDAFRRLGPSGPHLTEESEKEFLKVWFRAMVG